ncbi:prepilin-type N-terminal cleavage/methylation domain-containing protein [Oceanivirga miroungae]|uniref:General secretion pathway protein G n=1 Tax=Oceanivirga miroungae TaxID=1130046 RepID=A0A6I8M9G0_9FUSO|nr:prepilin-type N-terminal cleavage/methylation domain-containing protein [Oceanivirga miroungae]VWL85445.1 general secretion pathway protein G [Oceanivirga miroungae]
MKNKAFSLIEMIAVMAIIAIISSLAVPKISRYIDEANKTKVIAAVLELNNYILLEDIDKISNVSDLLKNFDNLDSLKINLNINGEFKIGNVKGEMFLQDKYVNAKIFEPDYYSNLIIGPSVK